MPVTKRRGKIPQVGLALLLLVLLALTCYLAGNHTQQPSDTAAGNHQQPGEDTSKGDSTNAPAETAPFTIINPYSQVNWDNYEHYRANLHTHTTASDGSHLPSAVIDAYHERGYTVLAITDHNAVTWPWEKYGREPGSLSMAAIQGNELSNTHHLGSYFSSFNNNTSADIHILLKGIGEQDGLAVLFHPGRYQYSPEWYSGLYREYAHLVGLEVINMGGRYPDDVAAWDRILTLLMPERPVWGFANDDLHSLPNIALCWNMLLLPELSEIAVRQAMTEGSFYFCRGSSPPALHSIQINYLTGRITVSGSAYSEVVWISAGQEVCRGESIYLPEHPEVRGYVRAELRGDEGCTYTNPFGILVEE